MPLPASLGVSRRAPTPADLLLLAILVGIALWVPLRQPSRPAALRVEVVSAAGSRRLDVRADGDYPIQGPAGETLVRIRDGTVWIAAAPCRQRACQKMGPLRSGWGSLVCVPNQVVLRFSGERESVDGVMR